MTAFFLQSDINAATTPYLVYLFALLSALMSPFSFSHLMASSWTPFVSSNAFLHYPIGALVYYLSFFSD